MNGHARDWRQHALSLLLLLLCALPAYAASAATPARLSWRALPKVSGVILDLEPRFERYVHRLVTRTENTTERFAALLGEAGTLWLGMLVSAALFLLVTAVSSVVDVRMLDLRHKESGVRARYLAYGIRTFFRLLVDRHTPYLPRLILALALVYWLVPVDLIPDQSLVPGFLDDLIIAIAAAKGFIYLCPDSLVASHAAEVEARA